MRRAAASLAALAVACTAAAAQADALVVRSTGPSAKSYPPGKPVPDAARIVLRADDQIVLLDARGTRTLKGPGTFSPVAATSAGADPQSTFAALVARRSDRRARIGAVRSMTAQPPRSPNIWLIDLDRSANVCVADPSAVAMWRGGTPRPATVTVSGTSGSETIDWAQGDLTAPWPAALPIVSGARYSITWPGATQPASVRFVVLGSALGGLEDLASQLIKNGCDAQLDLLIDTVALPDAAPAAGG